jgi:hypothetical protein
MAQHRSRQSEWPIVKREKQAWVLKPDGYEFTARNVAGPLRTGTAPGVGPRGVSAGGESRLTDYGMDRVSPRGFDPMGTALSRYGQQPGAELITGEYRDRRTNQR